MKLFCTQCGEQTTLKERCLYVCPNGHENWLNPAVGVLAYIIKDNKVLYGKRTAGANVGKYNIPGGFLEPGETAEQTLKREIQEEMGVEIAIQQYIGSYADKYFDRDIMVLAYVAKLKNESAIIKAGDDISGGIKWVDINNLPSPKDTGWQWYDQANKDLLTWWKNYHKAIR